jgi:type I restriction enzyme, S subunit
MSEWQEVSLGDVADFVTDKIAASSVMLDNYISTDNMQVDRGGVVPASTLPQASRFNHYKSTDTLFSNIRTYFRKVWLADRAGGASADVLIFRTKDEKKLNPLYLYYLISGQEFVDFTVLTAKGAKMPRGDKGAMMQFKLRLPSPDEQIEIAESLRCIDQKIELNQRMNETLEGMARSIFKSWFVDFDPVHAKAEGREPEGMDSTTAALFPSTFNEDGLPEGWTQEPFSELINLIGGGTPKTSKDEYWNGSIPWFSVVDAPNETDVFVIDTEKKVTDLGVQNSSTKILRPNTTIISARGTVGRVALTGVPMAMNQSCYGIQGNDLPDCYTYFSVKQLVSELKSRTHGSVFDTITRSTFETISFVKPPVELAQAYDEFVQDMMQKILSNLKQNQTLAAVRDTLLPKLISGELRVDTASEKLKEAVA